jgi:hypothetical protein
MSSSYASTLLKNQDNVLPPLKDNAVFSVWNYGSKAIGGKRRKSSVSKKTRKTYKRGKISKGRRTRSRRT